ncbi:unnamed protein product [[Candida] boidinii]|nr:unnamed protein product [[Candida] boidinii]
MGFFIPQESIKHLKEYKYNSEDRSILTKYVLNLFWIKFEKIFPLSMAPNMVTLLGLVFILLGDIVVFYYDPNFDTPSPNWCYFFYAFCLFMYQTFDACDGIHARRTGQSGPLGELFDHCCDAINTTLSCILFASTVGLGNSWLTIISQFSVLANFYLSTWETFFTHKLYLSEFSGPVEGILIMILLFLITGFKSTNWWKFVLFNLDFTSLNLKQFEIFNSNIISIRVIDFNIILGAIIVYFNIHSAKKNVDLLIKDVKTHSIAMKGLIPFFGYYLSIFITLLIHKDMVEKYVLPTMLTIGSTFAFVVGRIIVNHLTKQEFPFWNLPMFLPILQNLLIFILTFCFKYDYNLVLSGTVYTSLGLTLGIHTMFITEIIYEITTYLDIYALTIKHAKVN